MPAIGLASFILAAVAVALFSAYLFWPGVIRDLYLKAAARSTIPPPRFVVRYLKSRGFIVLLRVVGALGVLGGFYVVWSLIRGR